MTTHQQKQIVVINSLEQKVKNNSLNISTVSPVDDFERDTRICLTYVHFPKPNFLNFVTDTIISPLKKIEPSYFYYPKPSLHMTIKNVRVINDPPHFTDADSIKAEKILSDVIPRHKKFNAYFYRLLLFPTNLALMGTTDPELDEIIFDLDRTLSNSGIPDDKIYTNTKNFFINMTLARFPSSNEQFKNSVIDLSNKLTFAPYTIDSVTLVSCNAVFQNLKNIKTATLS